MFKILKIIFHITVLTCLNHVKLKYSTIHLLNTINFFKSNFIAWCSDLINNLGSVLVKCWPERYVVLILVILDKLPSSELPELSHFRSYLATYRKSFRNGMECKVRFFYFQTYFKGIYRHPERYSKHGSFSFRPFRYFDSFDSSDVGIRNFRNLLLRCYGQKKLVGIIGLFAK